MRQDFQAENPGKTTFLVTINPVYHIVYKTNSTGSTAFTTGNIF